MYRYGIETKHEILLLLVEICLNCTVMELKHMRESTNNLVKQCLNCTVMELKLIYNYRLILRSGVLIVPLWN